MTVRAFSTREDAIEFGRLLGIDAADSCGETGRERDLRIKRAMMYAAWEWDGGRTNADRGATTYQEEFGITASRESVAAGNHGPDTRPEKKRK